MTGTAIAARVAATIFARGQQLTVTRPAITQGGTPTTRAVYFLPQPLNTTGAATMLQEAGYNVGEGNPYDFVSSGTADVQENDLITYGGFQYRVMNVNPQVLSGVQVSQHCHAERQKRSS